MVIMGLDARRLILTGALLLLVEETADSGFEHSPHGGYPNRRNVGLPFPAFLDLQSQRALNLLIQPYP